MKNKLLGTQSDTWAWNYFFTLLELHHSIWHEDICEYADKIFKYCWGGMEWTHPSSIWDSLVYMHGVLSPCKTSTVFILSPLPASDGYLYIHYHIRANICLFILPRCLSYYLRSPLLAGENLATKDYESVPRIMCRLTQVSNEALRVCTKNQVPFGTAN